MEWKSSIGTAFFVVSAAREVEFGCDTMSRGHWRDVIVLNAHAPTEDERDDTRGSFYEEIRWGVL
jgi:hypothetical protein